MVRRRRGAGLNGDSVGGKVFIGIVKTMQTERELLEIVRALSSSGGRADFLNRRHQHRDQYGDDRDDHQQFDQREARREPARWITNRRSHSVIYPVALVD